MLTNWNYNENLNQKEIHWDLLLSINQSSLSLLDSIILQAYPGTDVDTTTSYRDISKTFKVLLVLYESQTWI